MYLSGNRRLQHARLADLFISDCNAGRRMDDAPADGQSSVAAGPPFERMLTLRVNGRTSEHTIPPHMTLAEFLRDRLGLMGTKVACDQAACGACTVLLDGYAIFACHTLAAQLDGAEVQTIEGLG